MDGYKDEPRWARTRGAGDTSFSPEEYREMVCRLAVGVAEAYGAVAPRSAAAEASLPHTAVDSCRLLREMEAWSRTADEGVARAVAPVVALAAAETDSGRLEMMDGGPGGWSLVGGAWKRAAALLEEGCAGAVAGALLRGVPSRLPLMDGPGEPEEAALLEGMLAWAGAPADDPRVEADALREGGLSALLGARGGTPVRLLCGGAVVGEFVGLSAESAALAVCSLPGLWRLPGALEEAGSLSCGLADMRALREAAWRLAGCGDLGEWEEGMERLEAAIPDGAWDDRGESDRILGDLAMAAVYAHLDGGGSLDEAFSVWMEELRKRYQEEVEGLEPCYLKEELLCTLGEVKRE